MGDVILFTRDGHTRAPSTSRSVPTNVSIGSPVASLNLLASGKDAVFRRARRLRKCETEQPTTSANFEAAASVGMNGSSGCASDMAATISTRNNPGQGEIFPPEISIRAKGLVQWDMGKTTPKEPRPYLKEWFEACGDLERGYQTKLARAAGCTPSYISNLIGGRRESPSAWVMLVISEYLGITVNDLYRKPPPKQAINGLSELSDTAVRRLSRRRNG